MRASTRILTLSALLAALAVPAAAQMPGGAPADAGSFRSSYLKEAYRAVETRVVEWESAWLSGSAEELVTMYTDDAFYFPAGDREGAMGRRAVQASLARQLTGRKELRTRMVDFSASGDMAYYAGRYDFQDALASPTAHHETGTFVLILQHSTRGWNIRSHVEKPDPPQPAAHTADSTATPAAASGAAPPQPR
jgi:ketosteroid isomerase-like protein